MQISEVLYKQLGSKQSQINDWLEQALKGKKPLFYTSVDIRDSGFKMAPVDTNIFPAGFNNLNQIELDRAKAEIILYLDKYYNSPKNILLIAENHTRNLYYLDHLHQLKSTIDINIDITNFEVTEPTIQYSRNNYELAYQPIKIKDNFLVNKQNEPYDLVILNNDLSAGYPEVLNDIKNRITPNPRYGWFNRSKQNHFVCYDEVLNEFCHEFKLDPFLLSTIFSNCENINFKERKGLDCVAIKVQTIIDFLKLKYKEYNIPTEPYVIVKPDKGTYGMGILGFSSGDEVLEINKDERKKASVIKEGVENSIVFIQEGIPSIVTNKAGDVAEITAYLIAASPIGYFLRSNSEKDNTGNLNSKGMYFTKDQIPDDEQFSSYLIASLAAVAAVRET